MVREPNNPPAEAWRMRHPPMTPWLARAPRARLERPWLDAPRRRSIGRGERWLNRTRSTVRTAWLAVRTRPSPERRAVRQQERKRLRDKMLADARREIARARGWLCGAG